MAETASLDNRIRSLVEEIILDGPCYLVDLVVRGSGPSPAVDVVLDSDDGPSAAMLAGISREVGFALSMAELAPGSLTVSSPGLDRPLRLPRQYRKHVGRKLKVCRVEAEKPAWVVGTLHSADADGIDLDGAGRISYADIVSAKVKLPW